jgi:hypothetical protein
MSNPHEALEQFRNQGQVLYRDPAGEFEIHSGDVFEAKTVKGHTNLIIALRIYEGWLLYAHGDKVRKVPARQFINAIESGEIEIRWPDEIDTERLSLAVIMLDAIANRRTFEESLHVKAEEADDYRQKFATGGNIIQ